MNVASSVSPATPVAARRGTILVGILVGLMLMAAALVTVAISGRREQDVTLRRMESMRAAYAEEAAAQIALREYFTQQDDDGDGVAGTVGGGVLASGITIGSSKGAATITSSASGWTIQPTGSNGLSTRGSSMAITSSNYVPGLYAECYTLGSAPSSVASVDWTVTPTRVAIVPNVNMSVASGASMWAGGPSSNYAIRFRGTVSIPAAGTWTFSTTSADGSILWINGTQVVNNDGNHAATTQSGTITLSAGNASFDLKYYTRNAADTVIASWSGPTVASTTVIPPAAFTCDPVLDVPPVVFTSLNANGLTIDGYASKSGAYGGSNITSNVVAKVNASWAGAMNASNGSVFSCNAQCGVGGTPSTAITNDGTSTISGTRTASTMDIGLMWMQPPLSATASSGALTVTASTTLSADARYSSITVDTANARLIISGHRIIQCDGAFTVGNNCTVELLNANSSLRLYMNGGNVTLQGTSQTNANTQDPTRMQIIFTASGGMNMYHSAVFHGYVLNPTGNLAITSGLTPKPTFYGAFHGSDLSTWQTGIFHADASFGSSTANTNTIAGWRQTQ